MTLSVVLCELPHTPLPSSLSLSFVASTIIIVYIQLQLPLTHRIDPHICFIQTHATEKNEPSPCFLPSEIMPTRASEMILR